MEDEDMFDYEIDEERGIMDLTQTARANLLTVQETDPEVIQTLIDMVPSKYKPNGVARGTFSELRKKIQTEIETETETFKEKKTKKAKTILKKTVTKNPPTAPKSLKKSLNSFLNVNSEEKVITYKTSPCQEAVQQTVFTATDDIQIVDFIVTSETIYTSAVPAATTNTTNPNFPTIQFVQYDESNNLIGIVGTYPLRTAFPVGSSSYYLQNVFPVVSANECYIYLKKGQTLKMRVNPLSGATLQFQNIVLDICLFGRVFDQDYFTITPYYKIINPVDTAKGFLYQNLSGKNAIVLTSNSCSSTTYEPFSCVQQNTPSTNSTYGFYYNFDFELTRPNYTRNFVTTTATTNMFEGFFAMQPSNPNSPSSNAVVLQRCMPFGANRIFPNEGIVVCYDSSVVSNPLPVLVSVFIVEF